jgi:hypothetical protein
VHNFSLGHAFVEFHKKRIPDFPKYILQIFHEFRDRFINIEERAKEIDFDHPYKWQGLNSSLKPDLSSLSSVRSSRRTSIAEREQPVEKSTTSSVGQLPSMNEKETGMNDV